MAIKDEVDEIITSGRACSFCAYNNTSACCGSSCRKGIELWLGKEEGEQVYGYQFPEFTKHPVGIGRQVSKVQFEAAELGEAFMTGTWFDVAREAYDVIHSCETLLRALGAQRIDIDEAYRQVVEDNRRRGYYV